jgi:hypothetical protein
MDSFEIKIDTKPFEEKIKKLKDDMPKIAKKLMTFVFQKMRIDIRKNIRSNFKRRKGWLLSDVNFWSFNDFSGAIFTRNSKRQGVLYASVLENGATITPKNGKYLVFYTGKAKSKKKKNVELEEGKARVPLAKVSSITIPPRPFFKPVVNDFWGGGGFKANQMMDQGLQKEINKYIEKKGSGLVVKESMGDN